MVAPVFGIISWFPDKEPERKQRIERLNKVFRQLIDIFGEDVNYDEKGRETIETEVSQNVLKDFVEKAQGWEWTEENLHQKLEEFRGVWKEKGVKPKVTMWAVRAAVTGRTRGADMVGILEVIGKEKTINRIKSAIK